MDQLGGLDGQGTNKDPKVLAARKIRLTEPSRAAAEEKQIEETRVQRTDETSGKRRRKMEREKGRTWRTQEDLEAKEQGST